MLYTLPPLMSYSLAPSSTMMSCTVHSPTDSLTQPPCTLVYIVCNPAPRGSPFELSLGLHSKLPSPICPLRVCVCWFLVFWPWVASSKYIQVPAGNPCRYGYVTLNQGANLYPYLAGTHLPHPSVLPMSCPYPCSCLLVGDVNQGIEGDGSCRQETETAAMALTLTLELHIDFLSRQPMQWTALAT